MAGKQKKYDREYMKAELCRRTLVNAATAYPGLRGAIVHFNRGSQYTSELYRRTAARCGVRRSMNSEGGRCHDNVRCESMWARMKTELIYDRFDTEKMTVEELKSLVRRYFLGYWNNRACADVSAKYLVSEYLFTHQMRIMPAGSFHRPFGL